MNIGHSVQKAADWFDEMQRLRGNENVRRGIFLPDGTPVGGVALQGIRSEAVCPLGLHRMEARPHKAAYFAGRYFDRLHYGTSRHEYNAL